jgi:hypothetical protein
VSSRNSVTSKTQTTTMKLSIEEQCRIWRALASYVEECETLAQDTSDKTLSVYYTGEMKDATELRNRFRAYEIQED